MGLYQLNSEQSTPQVFQLPGKLCTTVVVHMHVCVLLYVCDILQVFTVEEMTLHIQHLKGAHSKKRRKTTGWWQFFMIDKLNDLGQQLGGGSGNLCFADETAMLEKVKVGQGCATPWHFSVMIEMVKFVQDSAFSEGGHEEVYFHPVTNAATMELSPEDFVVFVNATGHDPIILNFD